MNIHDFSGTVTESFFVSQKAGSFQMLALPPFWELDYQDVDYLKRSVKKMNDFCLLCNHIKEIHVFSIMLRKKGKKGITTLDRFRAVCRIPSLQDEWYPSVHLQTRSIRIIKYQEMQSSPPRTWMMQSKAIASYNLNFLPVRNKASYEIQSLCR